MYQYFGRAGPENNRYMCCQNPLLAEFPLIKGKVKGYLYCLRTVSGSLHNLILAEFPLIKGFCKGI